RSVLDTSERSACGQASGGGAPRAEGKCREGVSAWGWTPHAKKSGEQYGASFRSCDRRLHRLHGALLVVSSGAAAQNISSSSIDGIVTDQSNSALPGVTVTITSPALQVPQLTTVTDGQGHYRFIDLPRGTYQLRFEIQGFDPLVRQGLDVNAGFAARVNVTMKVGSLTETVTVTGASP